MRRTPENGVATISDDDSFTQVVRFAVAPEKQAALVAAIAAEIERWVRHRPGFVSASLHASHDGHAVVNYAQWRDEAAFAAFTRDREGARLTAAVRAVGPTSGPDAVHCRVVRSIAAPT